MNSSTLSVLKIAIAVLGNLSVVTYGVNAKRTVAIQCRGGKSWGRYFVFNGPLDFEDRYEGMKMGLGAESEILQPTGHGAVIHEALDTAGYEKLLACTAARFQSTPVLGSAPNQWLHAHMVRPIWKWSYKRWGKLITRIYAGLSLAPLCLLTIVRLSWHESIVAELVYGVCFAITAYLCATLLDIEREVAYIRVTEENVGAGSVSLWYRLRDRALMGRPNSAQEAVEDVARGQVRMDGNAILVPVIAVRPSLEFWPAQWLAIFRRCRSILLSTGYFFARDRYLGWGLAFAICAWFQACLQEDCARAFVADTRLYEVNWFRRMPKQDYPEEYCPYRWDLN